MMNMNCARERLILNAIKPLPVRIAKHFMDISKALGEDENGYWAQEAKAALTISEAEKDLLIQQTLS
jgi:hypothetical protein